MTNEIKLLNDREKLVLYSIVKNFILTANPVASNYIVKKSALTFSSATIRNIMAELEDKGYIFQPHTSAGRIPTSVGYRIFVDQIMKKGRLTTEEKKRIREVINIGPGDYENTLKESSRILAHLSHQLSVIVSPRMGEGIFQRMDISRLSISRLLLVITIQSGLVKTIILEIDSDVSDKQLKFLEQVLNERLLGLKIKEIRSKFNEIVTDIESEKSGLLHLFLETADRVFDFSDDSDVYLTGTYNLLRQVDFGGSHDLSSVVEILEDKNIIVHLLDLDQSRPEISVMIGDEIDESNMKNCSIISARYKIGQVKGTIGIIGPTRMDYSHLIPLVEFTAQALTEKS
jgi:heat-inducible transcriptional repressor